MLLEELRNEHRQLEEKAAQLLLILDNVVPDPASVAVIRWGMAQALTDHCSREDRGIYDRLLASGDAAATTVAWSYRQVHGTLVPEFSRYISEWPVDRIAREWEAFGKATRTMLGALAQRIQSEEAVLYAHAARVMAHRHAA
jgi:hypothetical protein